MSETDVGAPDMSCRHVVCLSPVVIVSVCYPLIYIYGIRRSLIDICSITEVKRRRARFISGWVTAWDCQVPYTLSWGSENHVNQMARLTDFELDVKEPQCT